MLSYLTSNWATAIVLFVLVCRHLNCEVHPGLSKWVWPGWAGIGLLIIQVKSLQPIDAGIFHMKFQFYATYSLPHSPQSHILKCKLVNHPLPKQANAFEEPSYGWGVGGREDKKKGANKNQRRQIICFSLPPLNIFSSFLRMLRNFSQKWENTSLKILISHKILSKCTCFCSLICSVTPCWYKWLMFAK